MSESRRPSSRPSRWAVLTMPVVTVFCRAKGLPMATTNSPGRRSAEWPRSSAGSFFWGWREAGRTREGKLSGGSLVGPEPNYGHAPSRVVLGAAEPSGCRPKQGWLTLGATRPRAGIRRAGAQPTSDHRSPQGRPQVHVREDTERSGWAQPGGTARPRSQGPLLTLEVRRQDPEPQTLRTAGSIHLTSPPMSGASRVLSASKSSKKFSVFHSSS